MMNPDIIKKKIEEYENFLEDKLKRDLKSIQIILNKKAVQYEDWEHVKEITRIVREFKERDSDMSVRLDIGNRIMASAEITDLDTTYINIGLSYMLEMDCDEADKYSNIRLKLLTKEIEHFRKLAVDVKVHIKMILLAINELQSSLLPLPKEKLHHQNKH